MANEDLEFTGSIRFPDLEAEIRRNTQLLQQLARAADITAPLDRSAQAAQRATRAYTQADLSFTNMAARADRAATQQNANFLRQEAQLKKIESVIRQIGNLPIISPRQAASLRELAQIQTRLSTNLSSGAALRPETFAVLTTQANRFVGELRNIDTAQRQIAATTRDIERLRASRTTADPGLVQSLEQFRDVLAQTGAVGKSVFDTIQRGSAAAIRTYEEATKTSLNYNKAQDEVQRAGQRIVAAEREMSAALQARDNAAQASGRRVVLAEREMTAEMQRRQNAVQQAGQRVAAAEKEMAAAIKARDAAAEAADKRREAALTRQQALLLRTQRLPPSAERDDLAARITAADPGKLQVLTREFNALNAAAKAAGNTAKESAGFFENFFGQMTRYARIAAGLTLVYGTMRAAMASVEFVVDIDREMTRMATALSTVGERATLLPRLFNTMSEGMRLTGKSAGEMGKLVFDLQKAIGDSAEDIEGALIPALSLLLVGEANQENAIRSLVGIYNVFGDTLTEAATSAEKYAKIADILTVVSRNTTASSADLAEAIQFAGARARLSGVSLEELTVFLGLLQNSLQAAGRSGTGLARTFEALISNMGAIQKAFSLGFGPDANPLAVMFALLEKLQAEIKQFGQLTPETLRKIEDAFKLEQAGRNIEVLALQIDKFPELLRKVREEAGASKQVVDEFGTSLSASGSALLNSYLLALDKVLARMGGDEATGRFETLSRHFRTLQEDVDHTSEAISKMGFWGAFIDAAIRDFERFRKAQGEGAIGGLVVGTVPRPPVKKEPGEGDLSQVHLDRLGAAGREIEKAQKDAAALEVTERGIVKATDLRTKALAEVNREYARANPLLSTQERLSNALGEVGNEQQKLNEMLGDAKNNWQLLGKTQEEHAETVKKQAEKVMQAQLVADRLSADIQKEALSRAEEIIKAEEQIAEAIEKTITSLTKEKELLLAGTSDTGAAQATARGKLVGRLLSIPENAEEEVKQILTGIAYEINRLEINQAYQKIYDGLTKPFLDAAEADKRTLDQMVIDTQDAIDRMAKPGQGADDFLTPFKRQQLEGAPQKQADILVGLPQAEEQLRSITAQIGVFGATATREAFAAAKGFDSFADMVERADFEAEVLFNHGLRLLIEGFRKVQAVDLKAVLAQATKDLTEIQRATTNAFASVGFDPVQIEANNLALERTKKTLAELAASADVTEQALAGLFLAMAKGTQLEKFAVDGVKQLAQLTREAGAADAAFGLLGEEALKNQIAFLALGKTYSQVANVDAQNLITKLAAIQQKLKEQTDRQGLQSIGFSPQAATDMAHTIAIQEELNKKLQDGIDALTRYNALAEGAFQRQLENVRQTAQASGDVFTFLEASFAQAATQGHTFWDDMSTMAKNTAQNMATSMSDIFFALVNNKLEDAKAAFKNFFQALLREMTNFLASQTVRSFANLFFGTGSQAGSGGGGLIRLFAGGGGGGSVGQPGGIGTSDIIREGVPGGWMNDFALQAGSAADSLGNFTTAVGFATTGTSNLATISNAISAGWGTGEGLFGGIAGAAEGAWTGLSTVASSAQATTVALAGVGAALAAFSSVMDIAGGKVEAGVGGLVGGAIGAAGGAVLGSFLGAPWLGGFIGYAIGDLLGSLIGDLFGGISQYEKKRAEAAEEANAALGALTQTYKDAASSTDPARVLEALRSGGGGASNNSVRTDLTLTPEVAQRLGITGDVIAGRIVAQWVNITQEQFARLLEEFSKNPALIPESIVGSGDVPLLEGEDAAGVAEQIKKVAVAMLEAFTAFTKVRDKVKQLSDDIADVIGDFLPADTADKFKKNILDPLQQKISDALTSGLPIEEITAQLTGMQATLQAYVGLVDLYGQLTQDFAVFTGDFVASLEYARQQIDRAREAADTRIERAAKKVGLEGEPLDQLLAGELNLDETTRVLQEALNKVDLTPELLFEGLVELRTAVIDRFALERKLVLETEENIKNLYEAHNVGILQTAQVLGYLQIQLNGTEEYFDAVVAALANFARNSLSVAEALFNAGAVLKFTIDSLPTRIAGQGGEGAGGLGLNEIFPAVLEGLNPFIDALNAQITAAIEAGDFETAMTLMTQLGQGLKAAMDAAIAGVRQWEQLQVDAINKAADAEIKRIEDLRDAELDILQGRRDGIKVQLDAIATERWGLQQRKWAFEDIIQTLEDTIKPLQDNLDAITKQQEAIRRTQIRPIERAIRGIGDLMVPIQDSLDALNKQAALLRRQADDQLFVIKQQTDALNDQRKILTDEIELIEEWASAVESLRDYILELALSNQAPPDALGQFHLAQQTFDAIFKDFKKAPSAEGLGDVQGAAADLLQTMEALFGRSSTEYKNLYEELVKKLEKAADIGAGFGDPADLDDLQDELKLIDQQIEDLNEQAQAISDALELQLREIEKQTQPLEDSLDVLQSQQDLLERQVEQLERQIELLEDSKEPIQDQIDVLNAGIGIMQAQLDSIGRSEEILGRQEAVLNRELEHISNIEQNINRRAQDQIDAVNDARDLQIEAVHLAAQAQIAFIQAQMLPIIAAQQTAATSLFVFMRDNHYNRLIELTYGFGAAAWLKQSQVNSAAWIGAIMNMLDIFLQGDMKAITTALTGPESSDELLIQTLTNVDTTMQNLDSTLQAVNAKLGGGVPYTPPTDVGGDGFAEGTWYTHNGMYKLHEGELVPPRGASEAIRRNASSWDDLTQRLNGGSAASLTIEAGAFNIQSNQPAPAIAGAIVDIIERDIRGNGRIRAAIQKIH